MRSGKRSYCLDMLFRKDPRGIEKFTKINTLLKDLSDIGDRARCALPGNRKSARKINYWKGLIIRL